LAKRLRTSAFGFLSGLGFRFSDFRLLSRIAAIPPLWHRAGVGRVSTRGVPALPPPIGTNVTLVTVKNSMVGFRRISPDDRWPDHNIFLN